MVSLPLQNLTNTTVMAATANVFTVGSQKHYLLSTSPAKQAGRRDTD